MIQISIFILIYSNFKTIETACNALNKIQKLQQNVTNDSKLNCSILGNARKGENYRACLFFIRVVICSHFYLSHF